MKNHLRLLCAILWTVGLCDTAMSQAPGAARGRAEGFARDLQREYGQDSQRDLPPARRDSREGLRGPDGRLGRGPQPSPMFAVIDTDGDGVITTRELRKAAVALKQLDADGDGNITLAEASPQPGPGRGQPAGPEGLEDQEAMIDQIMANDKNGDGRLTPDEVPQQLGTMLSGADTNNDRVIDREELKQAVQDMQNRSREGGGPGQAGPPVGNAEATFRRLMSGDANGDGLLSPKEVPQQMLPMLRGADLNGDGFLNNNEVRQAVAKMKRRGDRNRGGDRSRELPPERGR